MKGQIIDICGEPHIISTKPKTVYKFYCNKCGKRGTTTLRNFECHPLSTRITLDDAEDE